MLKLGRILVFFGVSVLASLLFLEGGIRLFALLMGQYSTLENYHNEPALSSGYRLQLVGPDGQVLSGFNLFGGLLVRLDPFTTYYPWGPYQNSYYQVNSQGFRDRREFPKQKQPAIKRIFVLGGSGAFGFLASSNQAVFTSLLEQQLNQKLGGQSIQVINCGAPGFTSRQELALLATKILDYQPDLVLVFDGFNDFQRPSDAKDRTFALDGVENFLHDLGHHGSAWLAQNLDYFGANLFLVKAVRYWYLKPGELPPATGNYVPPPIGPNQPEWQLRADWYKSNLTRIVALLESQHIPLVIAIQPALYNRNPARFSPHEVAFARWYETQHPEIYTQAQLGYPLLIQAAQGLARPPAVSVVDLSRVFDQVPGEFFLDYVHVNDPGQQVIAQKLLPVLLPLVR